MDNKDDKKKNVNRRDFLSAGVGAMVGAGFYGVAQGTKEDAADSIESFTEGRGPANARPDPRNMAYDYRQLKNHYPVIVVGSGYGGSVVAARLSAAGKHVCVLERGIEWHPGMFPKNGNDLNKTGRTGLNPLGLLDSNIHIKSDVDVICASGLGGTSLLNAAIASRPESLVFEQKDWPKAIREDFKSGKITHYMDRAQDVLKSTKHPDTMKMKKTLIHKKMSEERGVPFEELLLNVNHEFKRGDLNDYGVPQSACTLCGDCCSGCNVGAKNVLTMNYLPLAKAHGSEIYTMMEVTHVGKDKSGKYIVNYLYHGTGTKIPKAGVLTTDLLVMAAGSMGSTQIMMRSKLKGLRLSSALGSRFSANGDVMGFSYNGKSQTNILGFGEMDRKENPSGQAIMVYANYRTPYTDPKSVDLMDRFLLLDGTVPSALGSLVAKGFAAFSLLHPDKFSDEQKNRAKKDLFDSLEPMTNGALNSSLIFFACGHDSSKGRYVLDDYHDRVHVNWDNVVNEKGFQAINREMAKYAKIHGGMYIPNPRMTVFGKRMMATHPLGGCPMGEDAQHGVVDHFGRVYSEDGSIHKGLYVVDAAIIPRSLGATPLLTISALAERIAEQIESDPSL
jgi:cholesterol oxidase